MCPFCAEEIKAAAKICRFCDRDVTGKGALDDDKSLIVEELPTRPVLDDVRKIVSSAGLADAARQFGVSAREMDVVRKKYDLALPQLHATRRRQADRDARVSVTTIALTAIAHLVVLVCIFSLWIFFLPFGIVAAVGYVLYLLYLLKS